ncbi:hypothetical protein [Streptococcus suis]|uniref:hypothetical protein n=1 Tax=Streptococcus suis TaxID=1307 RepID=UPI002AA39219|nr:hypothetical protein [Streptococcus suis]
MDEQIKSKLAINIAQLSLDKATLEAQNESLQATVSQQANTEQTLTNRIQELETENANLKEHNESLLKRLDDMTVEVVE